MPAADTSCRNCGAVLRGPHCHLCGQHRDMAHRSTRRMLTEALETVLDADSRFLTTLRSLALHPATLTRDYLAGKRVSQFSPIQLYVLALAFFLLLSHGQVQLGTISLRTSHGQNIPAWASTLIRLLPDRSDLTQSLGESAEFFAFLMVPAGAAVARLIFRRRRAVTYYDHLIFTLHSLAFQLILLGLLFRLPEEISFLAIAVMAAMPVHLFVHLRGVYALSARGTIWRMALLGLGTATAYSALAITWFLAAALLANA